MLWLIQYLQLLAVKSKRPEGNNWPSVFTVEYELHSPPAERQSWTSGAALLILWGYSILSFATNTMASSHLYHH